MSEAQDQRNARVEKLVRERHTGQLKDYGDGAFADAVRRMCSAFDLDAQPFLDQLQQQESDRIDALDGADGPSFTASGAFVPAADAVMYNLPMGADMMLVTGERQTAPGPVDDAAELLATIRDSLFRYVPGGGEQYLDRYLAAAAAREPVRATDHYGDLLWRHSCGYADAGEAGLPPQYCQGNNTCLHDDPWQALYVIPGDA